MTTHPTLFVTHRGERHQQAALQAAPAELDITMRRTPSKEELLSFVLPTHVAAQVWRALLESAASENGARMAAMDAATSNAADMIDKLTLTYNRARQAAITKELMEIVAGAEALKG